MNEKGRNILKLLGCVALAAVFAVLASPGLLAMPGVCPSPACTIWQTLVFFMIIPYYLAFAGFVLCFLDYPKARKYVFRAIVVIPGVTAAVFWLWILTGAGT